MSKELISDLNQSVAEEEQKIQKLQIAYPYVRSLCNAVVRDLNQINAYLASEAEPNIQVLAENLRKIADAVSNEPTNILVNVAESKGFIRCSQESIEKIQKMNQAKEISEERIDRVAEKIKLGDLDPERRRKVGERPETLKSIRQAQEKINQEAQDT
jgi:hypothetical protein